MHTLLNHSEPTGLCCLHIICILPCLHFLYKETGLPPGEAERAVTCCKRDVWTTKAKNLAKIWLMKPKQLFSKRKLEKGKRFQSVSVSTVLKKTHNNKKRCSGWNNGCSEYLLDKKLVWKKDLKEKEETGACNLSARDEKLTASVGCLSDDIQQQQKSF